MAMKIINIKNELCTLLRKSFFNEAAIQIDNLINRIIDPDETKVNTCIDKIISRCHIKWLGDYYIKDVSYNCWINLISRLEKEAKTYRQ